jgi:hypothetical protein
MSFNAGGTNVRQTFILEQGELTSATDTESITADATYTQTFIVPAGKIWILKGCQSYKASGTYTIGTQNIRIGIGGNNVTIYSQAGGVTYLLPSVLSIPAGGEITFQSPITGYSVTGDLISRLLIVEADT